MKIYEPKKELCRICNEKDSILLPIVNIDDKLQWYPVCIECKDKVPYPTIPVTTTMDKGYYFCPYPPISKTPIILN